MFSLMTLRVGQAATPALCLEGRYWAIADVAPQLLQPTPARGLMNVFEDWEHAESVLLEVAQALEAGRLAKAPLPAPERAEDILTPLQYPNKVVLVGANYYDHMHGDAGRTAFHKDQNIPVFFLKPPTTTLVGGGKSVHYPTQSVKFDYEIELAAVIGKRVRRLTLDNALECVAGYTIAIDLSARDWQRHPQHLVNFDLFGGKAFDDSCPLGPGIVPARFIDHANLPLKLWLNGELKQNGNTKDMIWSLPEQLVGITEHVTLEPGDVVSTGTPAGVGLRTQTFMKVGDKIDAEVGPLGRLSVEIIEGI
jgi:2-keto-4-pentenoate hydratase/2-oxohepta-3-ene-1,7-dioic acid hydratase in catechol pathway